MPQLKVKLTFTDAQREIIQDFCKQIEMKAEEFCKRSVFYAINKSYEDAEKKLQEGKTSEPHNAKSGVDTGDTEPGLQAGGDVDTSLLANSNSAQNLPSPGSEQV